MDSPHSASNSNAMPATTVVPGISGKKLTLGLIISLLAVGGLLSYVLWTYNRVDAARQQREGTWQVLAESLGTRYRSLEREMARGVDAREVEMELGEKFRLAIERFRSTSQLDGQLAAALEMEQILKKSELPADLGPSDIQTAEAYNRAVQDLEQLLASPGGQILLIFLNFSEPTEFPVPTESAVPDADVA